MFFLFASLASGQVKIGTEAPTGYGWATLYANVFGLKVVGKDVSNEKFQHAVNVAARYLDNDQDGQPDDPSILGELNTAVLGIFPDEDIGPGIATMVNMHFCSNFKSQGLYGEEIITDSCALDAFSHSQPCTDRYDASLEEVLHIITHAGVSRVYSEWEENFESEIGKHMVQLNGGCGWGFSGDYKDPYDNQGCYYAYDDETCDEGCIVTEGIYWALTTVLGSQDYRERAENIAHEWLAPWPDTNNGACETVAAWTCSTLQAANPDLYTMLKNKSKYPWLPTTLPDGTYSYTGDISRETKGCNINYFALLICAAIFGVALLALGITWGVCCCKHKRCVGIRTVCACCPCCKRDHKETVSAV